MFKNRAAEISPELKLFFCL